MELYGFHYSPYCFAVELTMRSLGLTFSYHEISVWDRSEILRLTDGLSYEVPLLLADNAAVFESAPDSQDIARHLEDLCGNGRLFPEHVCGIHEIVIHYLENVVEKATFRLSDPTFVKSISDPVKRKMVIRHKERKHGQGCLDRWEMDHSLLVEEAIHILNPLEKRLQRNSFLFGDQPAYADFLLGGILHNISIFCPIPGELVQLLQFEKRIKKFKFELKK